MLILSWNCWGLGNHPTIRALKSFVRGTNPSILFLSETKMSETMSSQRVKQFGFHNACIVSSVGISGGLWLLWKDDVELEIISQSRNLIHIQIIHQSFRTQWHLFCVYGPPVTSHRSRF